MRCSAPRNLPEDGADGTPMHNHSHSTVLVHAVWSTERRSRVLPVGFDARLAALLARKANALGCAPLAIGIASDHVHALLRLASTVALADVVQRLKGASARDVNAEGLLRATLRWQSGYWAESLAPADTEPLRRYLLAQRAHHDDSHPAELWQLAQT
jgi:putative transposase